jgi:hypothetical protein
MVMMSDFRVVGGKEFITVWAGSGLAKCVIFLIGERQHWLIVTQNIVYYTFILFSNSIC